jgi:ankyrin repeat protein
MLSAFQVDWRRVNQRLGTHPQEARQGMTDSCDGDNTSVLQRALMKRRSNYPPFQTVRRILAIFPEAVWMGVENYTSPLHLLCRANPSAEYLALIRSARPAVTQDVKALLYFWNYHVDALGGEIHLVSLLKEGSREAARIYVEVCLLLEYTQTFRLCRFEGLHTIAASTADLELLQVALELFPHQIASRDSEGRMPLHAFLSTKADGRPLSFRHELPSLSSFHFDLLPLLQLLMDAHPEAIAARDTRGRLPLHVAIESGWNEFADLLEAHPDSLEVVDDSGWLPFQLAAVSPNASLETVYMLLRRNPNGVAANPRRVRATADHPMPALAKKRDEDSKLTEDLTRLVHRVGQVKSSRLWQSLQTVLTTKVSVREQRGILHCLAGMPHCPKSLLESMAYIHAPDTSRCDARGRLPLHWLATVGRIEQQDEGNQGDADEVCPYLERLDFLLEANVAACRIADHQGQLPLHLAVGSMPREGLIKLMEAWPRALREPDGRTGLPPAVAGACRMDLDEIYFLLHSAPDVIDACREGEDM